MNKQVQFVYGITDKINAKSTKESRTSYALENVDCWFDEPPTGMYGYLWKMKVDNSVIPSRYQFDSVTYVE